MGILGSLTGDVSGLLERGVKALERIAKSLEEANVMEANKQATERGIRRAKACG